MNKKINALYDECLYYARDLGMETVFVEGMNIHKDAPKSAYYTYLKAYSTELKNLSREKVHKYVNDCLCEESNKRIEKMKNDFLNDPRIKEARKRAMTAEEIRNLRKRFD